MGPLDRNEQDAVLPSRRDLLLFGMETPSVKTLGYYQREKALTVLYSRNVDKCAGFFGVMSNAHKTRLSPVERKGAVEAEEAAMSLPDFAKRPLFGARLEITSRSNQVRLFASIAASGLRLHQPLCQILR